MVNYKIYYLLIYFEDKEDWNTVEESEGPPIHFHSSPGASTFLCGNKLEWKIIKR